MEPFHPIYEYLITHSNSTVKENHKEFSKYFSDHLMCLIRINTIELNSKKSIQNRVLNSRHDPTVYYSV